MADIFQEVDEEVRREQLKKLWQRYGNLIVATCLLLIAAVGAWRGYEWWQTQKAAEAGAAFERAAALANAGKMQEAEAAFAKLANEAPAGYRILARLREAAALSRSDVKGAVKVYDELAADTGAGEAFRDAAAVRAGFLLVDSAPYADMRSRLEPLTTVDRPFRFSARELLALSAWKQGDMAAARQWLDMIMTDPLSPAATRSRAEALNELLVADGSKG